MSSNESAKSYGSELTYLMNEEDYLIKNEIIASNKIQERKFVNKILFKKGNLLSYKKDTL